MVSNRHVNTANMKRFNRVHIPHKVISYVPKHDESTTDADIKFIPEEIEIVPQEVVDVEPVEELAVAKPKRSRKKKTEETVENNEENPEDNG